MVHIALTIRFILSSDPDRQSCSNTNNKGMCVPPGTELTQISYQLIRIKTKKIELLYGIRTLRADPHGPRGQLLLLNFEF